MNPHETLKYMSGDIVETEEQGSHTHVILISVISSWWEKTSLRPLCQDTQCVLGLLTCFYLMATVPFVTGYVSHSFVHEEAQIWTCSAILSITSPVMFKKNIFLKTSIFHGFILFFYPCFSFALSPIFIPPYCVHFGKLPQVVFGTHKSINKSINTSCVCKYGTLLFLKQFSHPLALWVLT